MKIHSRSQYDVSSNDIKTFGCNNVPERFYGGHGGRYVIAVSSLEKI
jgi:hypothetical protein